MLWLVALPLTVQLASAQTLRFCGLVCPGLAYLAKAPVSTKCLCFFPKGN
jgi:hypothetical protein